MAISRDSFDALAGAFLPILQHGHLEMSAVGRGMLSDVYISPEGEAVFTAGLKSYWCRSYWCRLVVRGNSRQLSKQSCSTCDTSAQPTGTSQIDNSSMGE